MSDRRLGGTLGEFASESLAGALSAQRRIRNCQPDCARAFPFR